MSKRKRRVFSREFKLSAVERMMAGEATATLSRELQVPAGNLYQWCLRYRAGGAGAVRRAGRPRKYAGAVEADVTEPMGLQELARARQRLGELERKIGQQQVDLDFFRRALRRVGGARQPSDGHGVPASTRSSKR